MSAKPKRFKSPTEEIKFLKRMVKEIRVALDDAEHNLGQGDIPAYTGAVCALMSAADWIVRKLER